MTEELKAAKAAKVAQAKAAKAAPAEKPAKAAKAAPAEKPAKAAKAEKPAKAAKAEGESASMGRKPSPEVAEILAKIPKLASRKGGISNIDLAAELSITTLQASALSRRLVTQGIISAERAENGRVTYAKV